MNLCTISHSEENEKKSRIFKKYGTFGNEFVRSEKYTFPKSESKGVFPVISTGAKRSGEIF